MSIDESATGSAASFWRASGSVKVSKVTSLLKGESTQAICPSSSGASIGCSKQGSKIASSAVMQSQASGRSSAAVEEKPQTPSTFAETVSPEFNPSGPNGKR